MRYDTFKKAKHIKTSAETFTKTSTTSPEPRGGLILFLVTTWPYPVACYTFYQRQRAAARSPDAGAGGVHGSDRRGCEFVEEASGFRTRGKLEFRHPVSCSILFGPSNDPPLQAQVTSNHGIKFQ